MHHDIDKKKDIAVCLQLAIDEEYIVLNMLKVKSEMSAWLSSTGTPSLHSTVN